MMKRTRDEVQFGARGGHHRILTAQQNAGQTIQYQIASGALKAASNVSDPGSIGGGGGGGGTGGGPAVHYTTCKYSF